MRDRDPYAGAFDPLSVQLYLRDLRVAVIRETARSLLRLRPFGPWFAAPRKT